MPLRSRSGKGFWALVLFMVPLMLRAQESISKVILEKTGTNAYRVQYRLNDFENREVRSVELRVIRKRGDVETEIFRTDLPGQFEPGKTYFYDWKPDPGLISAGDLLQARLQMRTETLAAAKPAGKNNLPPKAYAGKFQDLQLPLSIPVSIDGSGSSDPDGRIARAHWEQIGGPTRLRISQPDSLRSALSGSFQEGRYAFELTVTDNNGTVSTDRVVITIHAPAVTAAPTTVTPSPVQRNPSLPVQPVPPLRGGPLNAAFELLLPGLGHYMVSGDPYGQHRKPAVFAISAAYAGAVAGGIYLHSKSQSAYRSYRELADFREYQHDAAGNITGERGGDQDAAQQYYRKSVDQQKKARMLLATGAGIMAADFVYTLVKGFRNKKEWDQARGKGLGLILYSDGQQVTAGLRLKF